MVKIAVTAAGGGVGQSVIKSLKGTEYHTVAIDPDPRAAGLYMADTGVIGPRLDDEDFIPQLVEICTRNGCEYLFSGFDAELPLISANLEQFKQKGVHPVVSSPEVIALSNSKLELIQFMHKEGLAITGTATSVDEAYELDLYAPYIVKPTVGCRSQGVVKFNTLNEINRYFNSVDSTGLIIQEYIEGPEYTCGTVNLNGEVYGVIAMQRELRAGDTYKAHVDMNPIVVSFVNNLMAAVKPHGPCNVQLRLDQNNTPRILEINARCSGTTAARTLAGFNEPLMILDLLHHGRFTKPSIKNVEIFRYWDEVVVPLENRVRIK